MTVKEFLAGRNCPDLIESLEGDFLEKDIHEISVEESADIAFEPDIHPSELIRDLY